MHCPGQAPAVKRQPGGLEDFAKDATLMSLRARLIAAATNLLLTAHSSLTMAVVRDPLAAPSCKLQQGAWFFMHVAMDSRARQRAPDSVCGNCWPYYIVYLLDSW